MESRVAGMVGRTWGRGRSAAGRDIRAGREIIHLLSSFLDMAGRLATGGIGWWHEDDWGMGDGVTGTMTLDGRGRLGAVMVLLVTACGPQNKVMMLRLRHGSVC